KCQRILNFTLGSARTQDAPDQHWRAFAYVRVDGLVPERRHSAVCAGGVYGTTEILFRIDEGSIQVEDDQVDAAHDAAARRAAAGVFRGGLRSSLKSSIFLCSVLRWIPSSLLAAERFPPVRSSVRVISVLSRISTAC